MSLKDIDGAAITTKYIIRFINIFVAQRIFVTKKRLNKIYKISRRRRRSYISYLAFARTINPIIFVFYG